EVNKNKLELILGTSETLSAIVLPTNTLNLGIEWSSSNKDVVKVNKIGKVEAISIGEAIITVKSIYNPQIFKEVSVTVKEKDLTNSAIAYYDFEDINNNIVKDKWNNYNGVLQGAEVIDGIVGKALQFNDGNDNVTINSPATLTESWSVSMWVKKGDIKKAPASLLWDGKDFVDEGKETGTESLDIARNTAEQLGVHCKNGFFTFRYTVPKDEWVHLAWVNDKTQGLRIYIDGVSTDINPYTKNNSLTLPLKVIGGRNFVGAIDEVKVYNQPLSKAEVDELRKLPGLNVTPEYAEVMVGEEVKINAVLIGDYEDKTITFESRNPEIATVNNNGIVTGVRFGDTEVIVSNPATGFTKIVSVRVNKELNVGYTIPQYDYPKDKQMVIDREPGQYLGHPDMVALDDNNLITLYPKGHGIGPIIMKKSSDGGQTWSDRLETNPTWEESKETPTIYKLNMTDGTTKLIEISGAPGRGGVTGWMSSISDDNGETWSDFKNWHSGNSTIVAMASLVQLKDENGNFIDKWMGVYHNGSYINYKSYLTFDKDGNEQWSVPEPYLSKYRDVESQYQICEVGMFRSPDGKRIVALARSQSHMNLSTMFYSDDEGKTWSKPRPIQGALLGERHKATYDPISGRLLVTFREIILDYDKDGQIESGDWMAGDWIAWIGTYEDLMNGEEGDYRIRLAEDYTPSAKSGDTGYAGNVVLSDGTFVLNSYGCFDKEDPYNNNGVGGYNTYILGMRFKLGEIDNALGLVNKDELNSIITTAESLKQNDYSAESWAYFKAALDNAKIGTERNDIQQKEVNDLKVELEKAIELLEEKVEINADVNNDGIIDIRDLALVSKHYGKNSEDNKDEWNKIIRFDINKDNVIDTLDIEYITNSILQ
ncbi:LamG-like jellyroll fold domain-containing protein, partial [Clostridium sp.]|uniref:LamG-like jellyroll fold domain-containing protein n=1 Tax=Clostridium sp. TaxID=1506 RepID=UPI003F33D978